MDFFFSLKPQKAASLPGSAPLLPWLPTGTTLRLFGLDQAQEKRSGEKTTNGWRARDPLGFTSNGDEMQEAHGEPRSAELTPWVPGGPCSPYLAQLPQLVPGRSRILLLSAELLLLLFQLPFQDSDRVSLLRGLKGGTSVGTPTSKPFLSIPHVQDPPMENSAPSPRLTKEMEVPSLPSTAPEAWRALVAALPCAKCPARCPPSPSGSQ